MGVHPKSLYKRKKTKRKKVLSAADQVILSEIKEVIKARSTYGYKRVTAMYNRQRREQGLEKYNKKRIYRIMKANGLLLPKSGKMRDSGDKTGRIVTVAKSGGHSKIHTTVKINPKCVFHFLNYFFSSSVFVFI